MVKPFIDFETTANGDYTENSFQEYDRIAWISEGLDPADESAKNITIIDKYSGDILLSLAKGDTVEFTGAMKELIKGDDRFKPTDNFKVTWITRYSSSNKVEGGAVIPSHLYIQPIHNSSTRYRIPVENFIKSYVKVALNEDPGPVTGGRRRTRRHKRKAKKTRKSRSNNRR